MNWELVWQRLRPGFENLLTTLTAKYPTLQGGIYRHPGGYPGRYFDALVSFDWNREQTESEDILVQLTAAPGERFTNGDGSLHYVNSAGRDILLFEVEHRSKVIAALEALTLAREIPAPEYESMVMDFVQGALDLLTRTTPKIDALLAQARRER